MNNTVRMLIHIPHGFIAGIFTPFSCTAGILFSAGFFFYQTLEDWRIKDNSYLDVRGWMIGFPIGYVLGLALKGGGIFG